ncbi:unnamed protein product [Brassica napus]|uniref:(rape) hypothetical protein n=1 Tax=Brassica napus TaxID=3708 RepID=A0A817AZH2_BRANA|nr:unnamed protein product [Brassica napus]
MSRLVLTLMHNLTAATTTNSDQFNFRSLWHWSDFLVVATEEKIDRYLLARRLLTNEDVYLEM